jgi:hypothetical protein
MLKKVEAKCKRCKKEFSKKRIEQEYCSAQCRNAAWKKPRKTRLKGTPRGSVAKGPFSLTKTVGCKPPSPPDLGAFVRGQIERQREQSNPIGFSFPDASKGRVWLASPKDGSKITGDDCLWRVNIEELRRQEQHKRPVIQWRPTAEALRRPIIVVGRNDPVRDVDEALQTLKGFKVRIYIEGEKELQALGCGWRIVTCQFRGNKVSLHHNGNVATMKRKAFSELLAAVRVARPKRRRPCLRLVVSNPMPSVANAVAA